MRWTLDLLRQDPKVCMRTRLAMALVLLQILFCASSPGPARAAQQPSPFISFKLSGVWLEGVHDHEVTKDLSSREDDPYRDRALGWGIAPLIKSRACCMCFASP